MKLALPLAAVDWTTENLPRSVHYRDIYHHGDGIAESQRVFLQLNSLPTRFAALPAGGRFTIGELGFGTGLNCWLAADLFLQRAPAASYLHLVSFDIAPWSMADLRRLTPHRRGVASWHELWLRLMPPPVPGWHRRILHPRIHLSLFYGDAAGGLTQTAATVQAWFLDGFAPNRNPELWQPGIYRAVANASAAGATLATFSVAGGVRHGLAAAGFELERVDGTPHKRQYLRGWLKHGSSEVQPRPFHFRKITFAAPSVGILGAGIAGSTLAASLLHRGVKATIFDLDRPSDSAASRTSWSVLHLRLRKSDDPSAHLRLRVLHHAHAFYRRLATADTQAIETRPFVQLSGSRDDEILQQTANELTEWYQPLDALGVSALARHQIALGGISSSGITVNLRQFCQRLIELTGIESQTLPADCSIDTILAHPGINRWVIASPQLARQIFPRLAINPVWGSAHAFHIERPLGCVLNGDGYLAPLSGGKVVSAATYERTAVAEQQAATYNSKRLKRWLGIDTTAPVAQFRAARFGIVDRMPVLGRLPFGDHQLTLLTGLGSAGLAWAPFLAEVLTSEICGETLPITDDERAWFEPTRRAAQRQR